MGTGRNKKASITCVRGNAEKHADNAVFDESDAILFDIQQDTKIQQLLQKQIYSATSDSF
ncbi:MAG: hypothetical protein KBT34_07545 [Prevotella sp.]|nr:hypothetical protein [Candidatus Prevotella equi]